MNRKNVTTGGASNVIHIRDAINLNVRLTLRASQEYLYQLLNDIMCFILFEFKRKANQLYFSFIEVKRCL